MYSLWEFTRGLSSMWCQWCLPLVIHKPSWWCFVGKWAAIAWWYSLCATDPSRKCWEIQVLDFDSSSALRSCAASQGLLKQWVKGVQLKFWSLCSFLLSGHFLRSVKLFPSSCGYSWCLLLSMQGSSQLQISADSSETLFVPEQPPPPLPPPPLLPSSLSSGVALTAAKPLPTLIKVLF